jgi:hypothetical protein
MAEANTTLAAALRRAAAELQSQNPPPELQAQVLMRAQAARRAAAKPPAQPPVPALPRRGLWAWSGAAACATVLLASALLMLRPPAPALLVDEGPRYGGFLPVAPADRWPADAQPAWLVRTELQGERLAALGLPYDPARAGDSVRAELLMRSSGEVLAVRFVP